MTVTRNTTSTRPGFSSRVATRERERTHTRASRRHTDRIRAPRRVARSAHTHMYVRGVHRALRNVHMRRTTPWPAEASRRCQETRRIAQNLSMRKLTGATRRAGSVNCAVHGLRDSLQGRDARGTRPHHCDRSR